MSSMSLVHTHGSVFLGIFPFCIFHSFCFLLSLGCLKASGVTQCMIDSQELISSLLQSVVVNKNNKNTKKTTSQHSALPKQAPSESGTRLKHTDRQRKDQEPASQPTTNTPTIEQAFPSTPRKKNAIRNFNTKTQNKKIRPPTATLTQPRGISTFPDSHESYLHGLAGVCAPARLQEWAASRHT